MVERISDHGETVPTLASLHKDGKLTQEHIAAQHRVFEYCIEHHIVLGDAHLGNLVLDPQDSDRLTCIDGFGEKILIPVHRYSRRLNERMLRRKMARVLARIGLEKGTNAGSDRLGQQDRIRLKLVEKAIRPEPLVQRSTQFHRDDTVQQGTAKADAMPVRLHFVTLRDVGNGIFDPFDMESRLILTP